MKIKITKYVYLGLAAGLMCAAWREFLLYSAQAEEMFKDEPEGITTQQRENPSASLIYEGTRVVGCGWQTTVSFHHPTYPCLAVLTSSLQGS